MGENVNRFSVFRWGVLGGLFLLPWGVILFAGDRISAWWGDSLKDTVRTTASSQTYLTNPERSFEVPAELLSLLRQSPSWMATVRDPLDSSRRLLVWLAQKTGCLELKLIDEKSSAEIGFECGSQWSWLSQSGGPLLRVPLAGGPYSGTYKEILVRLPQRGSIEGEFHWISREEKTLVSRFGWVPTRASDSSFFARPRMSRGTSSN